MTVRFVNHSVILSMLAVLVACGGGSSTSGGGEDYSGTWVGSYAVTAATGNTISSGFILTIKQRGMSLTGRGITPSSQSQFSFPCSPDGWSFTGSVSGNRISGTTGENLSVSITVNNNVAKGTAKGDINSPLCFGYVEGNVTMTRQ